MQLSRGAATEHHKSTTCVLLVVAYEAIRHREHRVQVRHPEDHALTWWFSAARSGGSVRRDSGCRGNLLAETLCLVPRADPTACSAGGASSGAERLTGSHELPRN